MKYIVFLGKSLLWVNESFYYKFGLKQNLEIYRTAFFWNDDNKMMIK